MRESADIFILGALLFILVTGINDFKSANLRIDRVFYYKIAKGKFNDY